MRSVWIALGLFFTLWWTWVGFAVLYNRHGADEPVQRLLFLAASVPDRRRGGGDRARVDRRQHGVRAEPRGRAAACSPARTPCTGGGRSLLSERITRACLGSAALFAVSIAMPGAVALRAVGGRDRRRVERDAGRGPQGRAPAAPRPRPVGAAARGPRGGARRAPLRRALRPVPDHPARRGGGRGGPGLGERPRRRRRPAGPSWSRRWCSRPRCGGSTSTRPRRSTSRCSSCRAGRRRWRARSSRSATCSRPSRCSSSRRGSACCWRTTRRRSRTGWRASAIGIYLTGTRVFLFSSSRVPGVVRALLLVATFQLARLRPELTPYGYVWLLTGWMVMCAALSTRVLHGDAEGDLERYLGASRGSGSPARPSRSHPDP